MARGTQSSVIERIAARSGFTEFGYIPVSGLRFSEDIRKICEGNSCRNYGTSWACPPAVGTLEECRRRVGQYDTMLLFTKKYELESSFDFEAMGAGLGDFKKAVDRFHKALDPVLPEFLVQGIISVVITAVVITLVFGRTEPYHFTVWFAKESFGKVLRKIGLSKGA